MVRRHAAVWLFSLTALAGGCATDGSYTPASTDGTYNGNSDGLSKERQEQIAKKREYYRQEWEKAHAKK